MELYRFDFFAEIKYSAKPSNLGHFYFYFYKKQFIKYNIETKEKEIIIKLDNIEKHSYHYKLSYDDKFTLILVDDELIYIDNDNKKIIKKFYIRIREFDFMFTINNDFIIFTDTKLDSEIQSKINSDSESDNKYKHGFGGKYLYLYDHKKEILISKEFRYMKKIKSDKMKKYLNKDKNFF